MTRLTDEQSREVARRYRDHLQSLDTISEDLRMSKPTLYHHLRKHGVQLRTRPVLPAPKKKATRMADQRGDRALPHQPYDRGPAIDASATDMANRRSLEGSSKTLLDRMAKLLKRTPAEVVSGVETREREFRQLPPPSLQSGCGEAST